jgi:hypothetical protein
MLFSHCSCFCFLGWLLRLAHFSMGSLCGYMNRLSTLRTTDKSGGAACGSAKELPLSGLWLPLPTTPLGAVGIMPSASSMRCIACREMAERVLSFCAASCLAALSKSSGQRTQRGGLRFDIQCSLLLYYNQLLALTPECRDHLSVVLHLATVKI